MNDIANTNQMNTASSDNPCLIYTYCLTGTPVSFPQTMTGVDGAHGVYLAKQDGIFAVISAVSPHAYNEAVLETNMTDMAWLAPRVKRHEEVIEYVMTHVPSNQCSAIAFPLLRFSPFSPPSFRMKEAESGRSGEGKDSDYYLTPVVPMRFCTIYKNTENLFRAVLPHREKILNFLNYTADKAEWSVKVFCDKTIFMDNYDRDKTSCAFAGQQTALPGEAYLLAKKMLREKEEKFRVDLRTCLTESDYTLSRHADSYLHLHCTDKAVHGRPLNMVMNSAFLIERKSFGMFKDDLNVLTEKYKEVGLLFECSGPWPPYHFCPAL